MSADESPDVRSVVAAVNAARHQPLSLVHRFEVGSGAGAHEVTLPDGTPLVLKWWSASSLEHERFELRHTRIPRLRALGWPIPPLVDSGVAGAFLYDLWTKAPGSPAVNAPVPIGVVNAASALVERARGAAIGDGTDWQGWLRDWIDERLSSVPGNASLAVKSIVAACKEALATAEIPLGRDLIHGDFTPANLLIDDDQIVAVVDFDGCRDGDGTLDLIGIVWDLEGWEKASRKTVEDCWAAIISRVDATYGRALLSFWIVGTLAWAVGTEEEAAKIALSWRAWHRFESLPAPGGRHAM
jgi:hypothetical protein